MADSKDKMVRVSDETHYKLRLISAKERKSIRDLISAAVSFYESESGENQSNGDK